MADGRKKPSARCRSCFPQDLRGGAALVSAALAAEGFSTIRQTELIERGYERFPETLRELGAKIIVEKEI